MGVEQIGGSRRVSTLPQPQRRSRYLYASPLGLGNEVSRTLPHHDRNEEDSRRSCLLARDQNDVDRAPMMVSGFMRSLTAMIRSGGIEECTRRSSSSSSRARLCR